MVAHPSHGGEEGVMEVNRHGQDIGNNDAAAIPDSGITDAQREALVAFTG